MIIIKREEMKENKEERFLIIDFDSTFVKIEALDSLAEFALEKSSNKRRIIRQVKETTKLGMEGEITFPESLSRRLKLFSPNKGHVERLIEKLQNNLSESTKRNGSFFKDNSERIFIISGGFTDYIAPIIQKFGISKEHILANKFCFDKKGQIVGIEKQNYLAQEEGKVKAVKALGLDGMVWVVGDGFTDFEIKKAGVADIFVAFIENVKRDIVVEEADFVADSFDDLIELMEKNKTKKDK